MTARIRAATIGVGHFGRFHSRKYAELDQAELVAVCDVDGARAEEVAREVGCRTVTDYRELLGRVDAVSVVVPTKAHREIALAFLEHGAHVLVEKPIADTVEAADDLIRAAAARGRVLQVGHLERFSTVRTAIDETITHPVYIEANRISPFRMRGTDVSIVLDLMIHDIDMVLSLVDAPVESVDAVGAPVLSPLEDIANARIRFANGCVASITASRISLKNERKMRIFSPSAYVSVDFLARKVLQARKTGETSDQGVPAIDVKDRAFEEGDSLRAEIESFLAAIADGRPPVVSGEDGRRALATAIMIGDSLETHRALVQRHLDPSASPQM